MRVATGRATWRALVASRSVLSEEARMPLDYPAGARRFRQIARAGQRPSWQYLSPGDPTVNDTGPQRTAQSLRRCCGTAPDPRLTPGIEEAADRPTASLVGGGLDPRGYGTMRWTGLPR